MGVKYSAQESQELIQAMTNNLQVANEVTDRLSSGCDHLISSLDSGELTGAAYTAGKGLFTEIIIPSIKKLQAAIDDIQLELTSYKNADAQVSGYGDLDLDQLKKLKKLREEQLAIVEAQIQVRENWLNQIKDLFGLNLGKAFSEKTILYSTKSQIESGIQDLEDKIEKLEFFVSQVSQYFNDSLEVLSLAIKGATQLSKIIVDSDGNYYADGLDMSWVQKMKYVKIESHKLDKDISVTQAEKDKKKIVDDLVSSYNLDESMANALYKLQQGILKRAKHEGWTNEKVLYEYNRLVASPVYGVRATWRGLAGVVDAQNTNDLDIILADYGISEEERILFKDKIRKQYESNHSKDLAHEAIQIASFTELSWGDRDLSKLDGWKGLSAHIISTIGNSTRIGDLSVNTEKYESSFKGDIDSGRYDDADFNSDLDAITSYERMISKDVKTKDVFKVQADYNHSIQTNQTNRVEEFYTVMGNGDKANGKLMVETLIENNTIGGNFIKYGFDLNIFIGNPNDKEEGWKQDFYNYLDRGGEKMSGLKEILIVIGSVIVLATGLNLYFQYQNYQEYMQLKTSFEERDNIVVLQRLMASEKYASDIRKAGYVVPPDGAIRLDGGIDSIEIKGDIDLKISNPGRNEVTVLFETTVKEEKIDVHYILDNQLTIKRSYYSNISNQKIKESVDISQAEEERLLKIVQKELEAFMEKMYQTLYG